MITALFQIQNNFVAACSFFFHVVLSSQIIAVTVLVFC